MVFFIFLISKVHVDLASYFDCFWELKWYPLVVHWIRPEDFQIFSRILHLLQALEKAKYMIKVLKFVEKILYVFNYD